MLLSSLIASPLPQFSSRQGFSLNQEPSDTTIVKKSNVQEFSYFKVPITKIKIRLDHT